MSHVVKELSLLWSANSAIVHLNVGGKRLSGGTMMSLISRFRWRMVAILVLPLAIVFTLSSSLLVSAAGTLTQISSDPYHNKTSQHLTELEPDNFGWGHTIVSAFQVGRFWNGGASNIGWATSHDGGTTWKHGFLPGTTIFAKPQGP